ncbi:DnaJ domain-containing protein [Devosia crocina]|uniref:DnaJ domain-containing protein n=1 Tax=Devosia crocina TaxID=429728 RepID=A0A1I7NUV8_9HYPH|nr:DnaJ domain-containing protein [Devosia crocina]SFV38434.1 DnaJ domain-containing protein [Devosia crocina]
MGYVFLGALALLAGLAAYNHISKLSPRVRMRALRWLVVGGGFLLAGFMLVARRFDLALFLGVTAFAVLRTGKLGPFSFDAPEGASGNVSEVRSYRFAMELDHDTGAVHGRVLNGQFAGMDLMDLDEWETRTLLAEIEGDQDSLSLLESWLDVNRSGWREYFAGDSADESSGQTSHSDPIAEAYDVLGLAPGAGAEEIRAAHRELMKALHPDHGGSSYLAAKINQARDTLLDSVRKE